MNAPPEIQAKLLEQWKDASQDRPPRIMVCGRGGIGKSTLINRLLKLTDEAKQAREGLEGRLTTSGVQSYEKINERGIKICLFDTPGFGDPNLNNTDIIAMMERETKKNLDLVLYCISLSGSARLEKSDVKAMKLLTEVFTSSIWKKTMVVFTFANHLEKQKSNAEEYRRVINEISNNTKDALRNKAKVADDIVSELPFVTAGHTEMQLQYEAEECPDWEDRLFLKILERVDPDLLPAFFEVRWSWRDAVAALGGGGGGVTAGATCGVLIGAAVGAVGGPPGIALGAGIGAGVGAGIGAVGGAGTGVVTSQLLKIKHILKIKYVKWKLRSHSQTADANSMPLDQKHTQELPELENTAL